MLVTALVCEGPPTVALVISDYQQHHLPVPAHLARVLARLPPGADLAVLPGAHGHGALCRSHHRDAHLGLIND